MNYNQIGSASPSSTRSEDIPLLPRNAYGTPRHSQYPSHSLPPLQGQTPPRSSLKPALTLDTNHSSHHPPPPSRIPLPTNPAAAARLDHLRDSVDSIRSPQSRELLTSSPIQSTFSSAGEPTTLAGWTGADVFFEHLGKIRALGADVGRLHAEMEGVGVGWGVGKKEGEKGDSEKGKEETKDFDDAAAMFEKRQSSVEGIMSKLADLSSSLQAFHDLKDPKLGFPRGVDSTPPSRAQSQSHKAGSGPGSSAITNLPHKRSTLRHGETIFGGGGGGREDGMGMTGLGIHS